LATKPHLTFSWGLLHSGDAAPLALLRTSNMHFARCETVLPRERLPRGCPAGAPKTREKGPRVRTAALPARLQNGLAGNMKVLRKFHARTDPGSQNCSKIKRTLRDGR
jgi:hypothetical protein